LAPEPAYAVRRSSRARRARLTITRQGDALVVLPLANHRGWIERHRRRILAEAAALAERPALGAGRPVPLRGAEHLVEVSRNVAARRSSVSLSSTHPPGLQVTLAGARPPDAGVVLERWLRQEARRDLVAVVARRSSEMALRAGRISVRDQRTRWASASSRGELSFSWRLVLCPPDVLDYVVVHELAHLRWRGHGPRFWALVRRHVPDVDRHRRWLREHRGRLMAALD
jgi:predicted metal-dependent hydrolase